MIFHLLNKFLSRAIPSCIFILLYPLLACSQPDSLFKKKEFGIISSPCNLSTFNKSDLYSIPALHYSFGKQNLKSRFTWYDSPDKGMVLYDNFRLEYFPMKQFDYNYNQKDALIGNSIEYLFMLIDRKNQYFEILK